MNSDRSRDESRLRIALVAPPWYPVPPVGYGGTELVVYLLAEQLAARGHEVTVFGRQGGGDSFELIPLAPPSWTDDLGERAQMAREVTYLHRAYELIRHRAFDVVHENSGYVGMLLAASVRLQSAVVATLHGDLTEADGLFLGSIDREVDLVAISGAQQASVTQVRWAGVVHNAVDERDLALGDGSGGYLVELARICPDKGQDVAIEVARRAGRRLVLAGKVGEGSEDYFREKIEPHLGEDVEWVENVSGRAKAKLLGEAAAMLFPIQWEEPFGLAMVEAMACGTPVVATPRGAAIELIDKNVTGLLAGDVDRLVDAVRRVPELDRGRCREVARERFSAARMAGGYEAVYRAAMARRRDRA